MERPGYIESGKRVRLVPVAADGSREALAAPRDEQRASSRINWLLLQLAKADPADIHLRAFWPGRAPATQAPLAKLRDNPALLKAENRSLAPTQFEVPLVRDLGAMFTGSRTFIEQLEQAVPHFYEQVGQHLRAYVVAPPRLKREDIGEEDAAELER